MIAIIASIEEELKYLVEKLENKKLKKVGASTFYLGNIHKNEVVICTCHTGKVHAALKAQQVIDLFSPELIINCGVAGAIADNLNIGDVILMTDTIQTDMKATPLVQTRGIIPDINKDYFVQKDGFNSLLNTQNKSYEFEVYLGRILTADEFVSDNKVKEDLFNEYGGLCTDMETAAFAQTCYVNEISFAGIRGISDTANESADTDFKKNLKLGSDNCACVLYDILAEYN